MENKMEFDFSEYDRFVVTWGKPKGDPLTTYFLGLGGETGEAIDVYKKYLMDSRRSFPDEFALEMGDVLWYISAIAQEFDTSLNQMARYNFIPYIPSDSKLMSLFELVALVGQLSDIYKKHIGHGKSELHRVSERLPQLFAIWFNVVQLNGLDVKQVVTKNVEKLERRYPERFKPQGTCEADTVSRKKVFFSKEKKTTEGLMIGSKNTRFSLSSDGIIKEVEVKRDRILPFYHSHRITAKAVMESPDWGTIEVALKQEALVVVSVTNGEVELYSIHYKCTYLSHVATYIAELDIDGGASTGIFHTVLTSKPFGSYQDEDVEQLIPEVL